MSQAVAAWDRREDLIFEGYAILNASGLLEDLWAPDGLAAAPSPLTTPWHSSAGINEIRIVTNYGSLTDPLASFSIEEATFFADTANPVIFRSQSIPTTGGEAYAQFLLTGRMFRFLASGYPNDSFALTVRAIA